MTKRIKERLATLEQAQPSELTVTHIFLVGGDDDLIAGYRYGGQVIHRMAGESIAALESRAAAAFKAPGPIMVPSFARGEWV